MKRMITRHALVLTLVVFGGTLAVAQVDQETPQERSLKNQTHCPVMGGTIDSTVFTDIQGQRVYHCCPGCGGPLKADPDKYFQSAAAGGVLFENIQNACPVSGEELEKKDVFVDYKGRRVYFCCDKCIVDFEKDPQQFLSKLDENSGETESNGSMPEEHNH